MRHVCKVCKGYGRITCPTCQGDGVINKKEICYRCHGRKTIECKVCQGTGVIED